jgi:WD40 repeat protein
VPRSTTSPTASAEGSAAPSPANTTTLSGDYGLLVTLAAGASSPWPYGKLEVIRPDATVAGSVSVSPPSLAAQACGQGMGAWVQPPVSATNDQIYFRDGDTRIRMLEPPSNAVDVTTVPGNTNLVSSFSVSPDDQRIAVAVEDFSAASTIGIRLYVEDLHGGGHHSDIYTTTTPKGKGATTLFPTGWHQGRLILGEWAACTFEIVPNPNAWHVVDSSTAVRQATIGDANCIPSAWPSPAGVACFALHTNQVRVYDWTGTLTATLQTQTGATELSPSGDLLFAGGGGPDPSTTVISVNGRPSVTTPGHVGCLWIDESHVLAGDAVINYPSGSATPLPQGLCAGRFPGGL